MIDGRKDEKRKTNAVVEIEKLSVRYKDTKKPIIEDFNLTVLSGESVSLFGESGCGKSTILRCIAGIIPQSIPADMQGEILLEQKSISSMNRGEITNYIGMVFQNPDTQLFCDSVEDEIAFGLENICMPTKDMEAIIDEALAFTNLEDYRFISPNLLSGGQKQMVVLAAVLAMRPKVLLLDEALSQLDLESRDKMLHLLLDLKKQGQTIIMVDHDENNLILADRIIKLT